jgi:hypothetical protein
MAPHCAAMASLRRLAVHPAAVASHGVISPHPASAAQRIASERLELLADARVRSRRAFGG